MTDRERIAEPIRCDVVCKHYSDCYPFVSPVACTKIELWHDIATSVEHAGYTRQPKPKYEAGASWCPQGRVFDGVTDSLPLPEPSPDRVEAVANYLWKMKFPTQDEWECNPFDDLPQEERENLFANARSILSLFPEPVLTRISDTEIKDCQRRRYEQSARCI